MPARPYRVSNRREGEERDPPPRARPEALVLELPDPPRPVAAKDHVPSPVPRMVRVVDVNARLAVSDFRSIRCDGVGPEQAPQEFSVDGGAEADQVRIRGRTDN